METNSISRKNKKKHRNRNISNALDYKLNKKNGKKILTYKNNLANNTRKNKMSINNKIVSTTENNKNNILIGGTAINSANNYNMSNPSAKLRIEYNGNQVIFESAEKKWKKTKSTHPDPIFSWNFLNIDNWVGPPNANFSEIKINFV